MKKLKHDVATAQSNTELSPDVKHKLVDEILQRLKSLEENSNVTQLRGLCYSIHTWKKGYFLLLYVTMFFK